MKRKYKRLRHEDRREIQRLLEDRRKVSEIAEILSVNRTTIYKEFERAGMNWRTYNADMAQATVKPQGKQRKVV